MSRISRFRNLRATGRKKKTIKREQCELEIKVSFFTILSQVEERHDKGTRGKGLAAIDNIA